MITSDGKGVPLACLAVMVAMTVPASSDVRTPEQARRVANPPVGVAKMVYSALGAADKPEVSLLLFGEKTAEWRSDLKEDLATMSHLIGKRIAGGGGGDPIGQVMQRTMGINVYLGGGHAKVDYIDGYGAIFRARVGFPLMEAEVDGVGGGGEVAVEKEPSEWEKAKQELSGARPPVPNRGEGAASRYRITGPTSYVDALNLAGKYSKERVEALRRDLIAGLGAATNIRGLSGGEVVVVEVSGPAAGKIVTTGEGGAVQGQREAQPVKSGVAGTVLHRDPVGAILGMPGGKTGMNLRARIADLRRLAAGEIDEEAFAATVEVFGYRE